ATRPAGRRLGHGAVQAHSSKRLQWPNRWLRRPSGTQQIPSITINRLLIASVREGPLSIGVPGFLFFSRLGISAFKLFYGRSASVGRTPFRQFASNRLLTLSINIRTINERFRFGTVLATARCAMNALWYLSGVVLPLILWA